MPTASALRKNVQIISLSIPIGLDSLLQKLAHQCYKSKSQFVSDLLVKHTGYNVKNMPKIVPTERKNRMPFTNINRADASTAMKALFPNKANKQRRLEILRRKRERAKQK